MRKYVSKSHDKVTVLDAFEQIRIELANLAKRVTCDLELAFNRRLAVLVVKIGFQRAALQETRQLAQRVYGKVQIASGRRCIDGHFGSLDDALEPGIVHGNQDNHIHRLVQDGFELCLEIEVTAQCAAG